MGKHARHINKRRRCTRLTGAVSLQLVAVVGGQDGQRVESGISGSLDIMTTTSNLSDEVSGEATAEGMREMWRRAPEGPRSTDVNKPDPA